MRERRLSEPGNLGQGNCYEETASCYDCRRCAGRNVRGCRGSPARLPARAASAGLYLDWSLLGRQRRLQLGPREARRDHPSLSWPWSVRHHVRVAEDRRRDRRRPVRLQLSVRSVGVGLGNRHPGLRPERRLDPPAYGPWPSLDDVDQRPQAGVVRNGPQPPGCPVGPQRSALRNGGCRLWSGQGYQYH